MNKFLLWIAQGFGVGRIPLAPGTFGSVLGLLWCAVLLMPGNLWVFIGGTIAGIALSIWLCDVGEKELHQKDPGSVVMDEICAMPVCYAGWIGILLWQKGVMPAPEYFLANHIWPLTIGVFVAFRFFDVLKPWPIGQSQALHGGLGITIDDVLAAVYVNALVLAAYAGNLIIRH